jgi:hypothetical protein
MAAGGPRLHACMRVVVLRMGRSASAGGTRKPSSGESLALPGGRPVPAPARAPQRIRAQLKQRRRGCIARLHPHNPSGRKDAE